MRTYAAASSDALTVRDVAMIFPSDRRERPGLKVKWKAFPHISSLLEEQGPNTNQLPQVVILSSVSSFQIMTLKEWIIRPPQIAFGLTGHFIHGPMYLLVGR